MAKSQKPRLNFGPDGGWSPVIDDPEVNELVRAARAFLSCFRERDLGRSTRLGWQQLDMALWPFALAVSDTPSDTDDKTWTTKDGTVVVVRDMSDAHLANAHAMVKRKLTAIEQKLSDILPNPGWDERIDLRYYATTDPVANDYLLLWNLSEKKSRMFTDEIERRAE